MPTAVPGKRLHGRLLSLALVTIVLLCGCSVGGSGSGRTANGPIATHVGVITPNDIKTNAEVGRIVGRLPAEHRKAARKQVTAVVDRWWQAAYLSGDLAASEVSAAFPGFTAGARKRATSDRDLMTNADLGADEVTPLKRELRLDLLAVDTRVRSVTARFELRVRTTGERAGRLQMRGRLFLTRQDGDWRIFGYDVSKGWL